MNENSIRGIAAKLREHADALDWAVSTDAAQAVTARDTAVQMIDRLMTDGATEAEAIATAAEVWQIAPADIERAYAWQRDKALRIWRASLPYRVQDLAAAGLRDADIARLVGIPRGQVGRIRAKLRERPLWKPKG